MEQIATFFAEQPAWLQTVLALLALAIGSLLTNFIIKKVLIQAAAPFLDKRSKTADTAAARLASAVPLMIISNGIELVPHLNEDLVSVISNVAGACITFSVAMAISKALDYIDEVYRRTPDARSRPIKGYIQVLKILIYCAAAIMVISILIQQSPLLLLSGLGAMAAVLLLVFKDTILSLVASVQLTSNDMLRVGDWIEMPQMNADGDVIDIALHTVKIQNFDKTITTIPTHRLISESFKNWRGMTEAGGRRIKRSLLIDQTSVHFLSEAQVEDLHQFRVLGPYLEAKEGEIAEWNAAELAGQLHPVNARRLTNLGTFRAYIFAYLRSHPRLAGQMTTLVRQLPPSAEGVPIEIYCFTDTTDWSAYEAIQADIFDHLLSILPIFGLRLCQQPTGFDMQKMAAAVADEDAPEI